MSIPTTITLEMAEVNEITRRLETTVSIPVVFDERTARMAGEIVQKAVQELLDQYTGYPNKKPTVVFGKWDFEKLHSNPEGIGIPIRGHFHNPYPGGAAMPWQGTSDEYGKWSDLPVKHDAVLYCEHCNTHLPHEVTSYHDCDYRVCKRCGTRTKWIPVRGTMVKDEERRDDERWRSDLDDKRNASGYLGRPKGAKDRKKRRR